MAVIVTVGVNSDGRREILSLDIGPSEAETFWTAFLRELARRALRGVKLVVSDAHEGIKAAVSKIFNATWKRCRLHFMRNVLAHAGKSGRRVVAAFHRHRLRAGQRRGRPVTMALVADKLRPKLPKLAAFLDDAETDVLAYISFPPHIAPNCT
ncbi:mobile element protein [Rhodopseudomonas palustris]|nr:mobile element protein [Rhodopseudomonas palustris]